MFSVKFDENFLSVTNNFIEIKEAINESTNHFDFNVLYERLLDLSELRKINYTTTWHSQKNVNCSLIINGMDIVIKNDGARYYINDIFTRITDLTNMVKKAICYNNVDEYNKYVKDVSYIGLDLKTLINNGIVIYLEAPFEQNIVVKMKNKRLDKLMMRFSLLWDIDKRSKIYLVLNGVKYSIKNKTAFKKEFMFPEKHIKVDDLQEKLKTCLENYSEESFFEIIDNAVKENIIIKKRGEDLLNQTIVGTKAKREEITINGTLMKGYSVLGIKTNSSYFIEEIGLNVYKLVNGFWTRRCVISDGNKQRIWEDKVANRLINIYNENSRIHTIIN